MLKPGSRKKTSMMNLSGSITSPGLKRDGKRRRRTRSCFFFLVCSGQEKYYGRKNYYRPKRALDRLRTPAYLYAVAPVSSQYVQQIFQASISKELTMELSLKRSMTYTLGRNTGFTRSKFHCQRRSICMSCTTICLNVKLLAT